MRFKIEQPADLRCVLTVRTQADEHVVETTTLIQRLDEHDDPVEKMLVFI